MQAGKRGKPGAEKLPAAGRVAECSKGKCSVVLSSGRRVVIEDLKRTFSEGDRVKLSQGPEGKITVEKISPEKQASIESDSKSKSGVSMLKELEHLTKVIKKSPDFKSFDKEVREGVKEMIKALKSGSVKEILRAGRALNNALKLHTSDERDLLRLRQILSTFDKVEGGPEDRKNPLMIMNIKHPEIVNDTGRISGMYFFKSGEEAGEFIRSLINPESSEGFHKIIENLKNHKEMYMSVDKTSSGTAVAAGSKEFAASELSGFFSGESLPSAGEKEAIENLIQMVRAKGRVDRELIQAFAGFSPQESSKPPENSPWTGESGSAVVRKASEMITRGANHRIDSSDFVHNLISGTSKAVSETSEILKDTYQVLDSLKKETAAIQRKVFKPHIRSVENSVTELKGVLKELEKLQEMIRPGMEKSTLKHSTPPHAQQSTGYKGLKGDTGDNPFLRMIFKTLGLDFENRLASSAPSRELNDGSPNLKLALLNVSKALKSLGHELTEGTERSDTNSDKGKVAAAQARDSSLAEFTRREGIRRIQTAIKRLVSSVEKNIERIDTFQLLGEKSVRSETESQQILSIPVRIDGKYRDVKLLFKNKGSRQKEGEKGSGVRIDLTLSALGSIGVDMKIQSDERISINLEGLTGEGEGWFLDHRSEMVERLSNWIGFKGVDISISRRVEEGKETGQGLSENNLIDMRG